MRVVAGLVLALALVGACTAQDVTFTGPGGGDDDGDAGTDGDTAMAHLVVAPGTVPFDPVLIGNMSGGMDITVTNDGAADSGVPVVSVTGADLGDFSQTSDCTILLAPTQSCTVTVRFAPTGAGDRTARVTVSADPGGSGMADLAGVGLTPGAIQIMPSSHDFMTAELGVATTSATFTVRNTGTETTGVPSTTLNPAHFQITSNTCSAALGANGTCSIDVRFNAAAVGSQGASLTVSATPGGTGQSSLSGVGAARLTVTKTGNGGGTVTSTPGGITCGGTCNALFTQASVSLAASGDATSVFDGWSGGGCGATSPCAVAMDASKTVTATFTRGFLLTVNVSGPGTVTSNPGGVNCPGDCTELIRENTMVTLTPQASANGRFLGFSGACTGMTCMVTMSAARTVNAQFAVEVPGGDITAATTWTSTNVYVLTGRVFVRGAVLTIQPGTSILADAGGGLFVASNGRLEASGTAAQPIVFSSSRAAPVAGDWLGVALAGLAPINMPGGSANLEGHAGGTFTYGGAAAAHSCGTLRYVRIQYAGAMLAAGIESNGLTLAACGTGTTIDFVQVHRGTDDGIEIFGGGVNLRHVISTQNEDDAIDWDQGWLGRAQFLIAQLPAVADNSIEADNNATDNAAAPRSSPSIFNYTLVGNASNTLARGMFLRRGTGGAMRNGVVLEHRRVAVDVVDMSTIAEWGNGTLTINNTMFYDSTGVYWPVGFDTDTFDEQASIMDAAHSNVMSTNPMLTSPFNAGAPNFRPQTGSPALSGGGTPPNDGFFDTTATFRGAMGATDWTTGWTAYPN